MPRRRRYYRRKPKKRKRRLEVSLGTSGNMQFRGLKKFYNRASKFSKKLSKIT